MASAIAEIFINDVVQDFIDRNVSFTAKDVTDSVKDKLRAGNHPFERHNDLKDTVHSTCSRLMDHNWNRSLVSIPNVPDQAFLYHPVTEDPKNYVDKLKVVNNTGNPVSLIATMTPPVVASLVSIPVATKNDDPYNRATDQDGRLIIAKQLVNSIGLSEGDSANVTVHSDRLEISSGSGETVSADAQGRFRLNPTMLKKIGDFDRYSIEVFNNSIIVRGV